MFKLSWRAALWSHDQPPIPRPDLNFLAECDRFVSRDKRSDFTNVKNVLLWADMFQGRVNFLSNLKTTVLPTVTIKRKPENETKVVISDLLMKMLAANHWSKNAACRVTKKSQVFIRVLGQVTQKALKPLD